VRVALDTNVLAYAEGVNGPSMKTLALELVGSLPQASVVLPVQTLGELFQLLVRKAGRSRLSARVALRKSLTSTVPAPLVAWTVAATTVTNSAPSPISAAAPAATWPSPPHDPYYAQCRWN
jgi:predicted nucleic acid-binding protein